MSDLRCPCITFTQAGHTLILFACSAKSLWDVTQVNQREEDGETGYQRGLTIARIPKLAQFIEAGNLIPTSVLISFEHAKLSRDKTSIAISKRKDAGWVIDGQHRLAAAAESKADIVLPVVAFIDLPLEEQIGFFVTINKEQRGVSSSLYLELLKNLPGVRNPADDAKARAVDLAHLLRQDEESPFYGRIVSTTSPRAGEISLTNFVRKVAPMLKGRSGRLSVFREEDRTKILNSYYRALSQTFPEEYNIGNSIFFRTVGFGALMSILPTVLDITLAESHGFRVSHVCRTFERIADYDFSRWRGATGSGSEGALATEVEERLRPSDAAGQSAIEFD